MEGQFDKKIWVKTPMLRSKNCIRVFLGGARQHHLTRHFELRASSLLDILINIMFCQKCEKIPEQEWTS